jgi:hypothetical protein
VGGGGDGERWASVMGWEEEVMESDGPVSWGGRRR